MGHNSNIHVFRVWLAVWAHDDGSASCNLSEEPLTLKTTYLLCFPTPRCWISCHPGAQAYGTRLHASVRTSRLFFHPLYCSCRLNSSAGPAGITQTLQGGRLDLSVCAVTCRACGAVCFSRVPMATFTQAYRR